MQGHADEWTKIKSTAEFQGNPVSLCHTIEPTQIRMPQVNPQFNTNKVS